MNPCKIHSEIIYNKGDRSQDVIARQRDLRNLGLGRFAILCLRTILSPRPAMPQAQLAGEPANSNEAKAVYAES